MFNFIKNALKKPHKTRGQAFTEYLVIISLVGLVLVGTSTNLFDSIKVNFYAGLMPTNKPMVEVPAPPAGMPNMEKSKPLAKITGPQRVHVGETVTFTDDSTDSDGRIVRTSWGTKTMQKQFLNEGVNSISLEVWDNDGLSAITTIEVIVGNQAPIARINYEPNPTVRWKDTVTFRGGGSEDPDGDRLIGHQWFVDGTPVNWPLDGHAQKFEAGNYEIGLEMEDQFGKKSERSTVMLNVRANQPPIATIGMSPESNINDKTNITWSSSGSYDPDDDRITEIRWEQDGTRVTAPSINFTAGNHKVRLQVVDEWGKESGWAEKTFAVTNSNRPPTAVINMAPASGPYYSDTNIVFTTQGSSDPDGDNLTGEEWIILTGANANKTYTSSQLMPTNWSEGEHSVKLKVKDSNEEWSSWVTKNFTVTSYNYNQPIDGTYNYEGATTYLNSGCDDCFYELNIPFNFKFYDKTFNKIYVDNNGLLTFISGTSAYSNVDLSSTSVPDYSIAMFWDDLDFRDGGGIYYKTNTSVTDPYIIVEFRDVKHYNISGTPINFQAKLHQSGKIELFYKSVVFNNSQWDKGASATVGIKKNSTTYSQYLFDSPKLSNNQALFYYP